MDFDIGVVGLGAMGSAAVRAVAATGTSVVGFDQLDPPHTLGSTHGHTRIIREAYFEHPLYVPLVQRAYELWQALERESGQSLLRITGGLMVGPRDGELFGGSVRSAAAHNLPHQVMDHDDAARSFPAYRFEPGWMALREERAGVLYPERCVSAALAAARTLGAELRTGEQVRSWHRNGRGIAVTTQAGTYSVERLIVAAGPWVPTLGASLGLELPLTVERQLSHWFQPSGTPERYAPDRTPIALWETAVGQPMFATFPDFGHGVKCGMHHDGAATTAASVNRAVSSAEDAAARTLLERVMPGAGGECVERRVCLYTNTPDSHFLIDWVDDGRVLLVSPCSGHGFKFASAIGEIASQLTLTGRTWMDLKPFSLSRFG